MTDKLFDGLSAWFSSSVEQHHKDQWGNNGGQLASSLDHANYVFSDDAKCEDTARVFQYNDDIDLAIFRSSWIQEAIKSSRNNQLSTYGIETFMLLPESVLEELSVYTDEKKYEKYLQQKGKQSEINIKTFEEELKAAESHKTNTLILPQSGNKKSKRISVKVLVNDSPSIVGKSSVISEKVISETPARRSYDLRHSSQSSSQSSQEELNNGSPANKARKISASRTADTPSRRTRSSVHKDTSKQREQSTEDEDDDFVKTNKSLKKCPSRSRSKNDTPSRRTRSSVHKDTSKQKEQSTDDNDDDDGGNFSKTNKSAKKFPSRSISKNDTPSKRTRSSIHRDTSKQRGQSTDDDDDEFAENNKSSKKFPSRSKSKNDPPFTINAEKERISVINNSQKINNLVHSSQEDLHQSDAVNSEDMKTSKSKKNKITSASDRKQHIPKGIASEMEDEKNETHITTKISAGSNTKRSICKEIVTEKEESKQYLVRKRKPVNYNEYSLMDAASCSDVLVEKLSTPSTSKKGKRKLYKSSSSNLLINSDDDDPNVHSVHTPTVEASNRRKNPEEQLSPKDIHDILNKEKENPILLSGSRPTSSGNNGRRSMDSVSPQTHEHMKSGNNGRRSMDSVSPQTHEHMKLSRQHTMQEHKMVIEHKRIGEKGICDFTVGLFSGFTHINDLDVPDMLLEDFIVNKNGCRVRLVGGGK